MGYKTLTLHIGHRFMKTVQTRLTERRKQAEDLYKSLIKRGTAVEKEALKALADLELDSLADRSKLEAQMKKAKSRFDDLKTKFGKAA